MATIDFRITNLPQSTPDRVHTKTLANTKLPKWITVIKEVWGQVDDGAGGQRDMTDEEAIDQWLLFCFSAGVSRLRRHEKDKAGRVARRAPQTDFDTT